MLVSVIIPAYNREKTIEAAVRSILDQTYENLEVIVVDDCSKDNTVAVVKGIEDPRVRVVCCEKNGGACVARNIGIDNSKGEIIAFQDSDDEWHKDKLEKSLKAIEEQNADFVFSALRREELKKGKKVSEVIPVYNLNNAPDKFERILSQNYVSTQTMVAKRKVFEKVRFDKDFPRFQDWDVTIRVIKNNFKVYFINESLVESYLLGDAISYDVNKAKRALELIENKYKEDYEKRPQAYVRFMIRSGFLIEMSGSNGSMYFKKAYKSSKRFPDLLKYICAKLRIYRPLCNLVNKFK